MRRRLEYASDESSEGDEGAAIELPPVRGGFPKREAMGGHRTTLFSEKRKDAHNLQRLEERVRADARVKEDGEIEVVVDTEAVFTPQPRLREPCCTKWKFRGYVVFVCCWVLPVVVFAPTFFLLTYQDKDNDYSEFRPSFCAGERPAFYCVPGKTMASLLEALAVWPLAVVTLVLGNLLLLRRAYRAYVEYINERKRQHTERVRKRDAVKWESDAIRALRLKREREEYNKKVIAIRAERRRAYFQIEFYQYAKRRLRIARGTCMDSFCWSLGRQRRFKWNNLYWGIGFVFCVFIPLVVLVPIVVERYGELGTLTSGAQGKRTLLAVVVIVCPILAIAILAPIIRARRAHIKSVVKQVEEERAARLKARQRRMLKEYGELKNVEPDADVDDLDEELADLRTEFVRRVREPFSSEREKRAVQFFSHICSPFVGSVVLVFFFLFIVPLCIVLPMVAIVDESRFASSLSPIEGSRVMLEISVGLPYLFIIVWALAKTQSLRRPVKSLGYDPIEPLLDMARERGLTTWDVGEYPNWSIGHGVVTTGIRVRQSPFLHTGYRLIRKRAILTFFAFVVFPLTCLLPLAIHGQAGFDARDLSNGMETGVSTFICFAFALGYPIAWVSFFGFKLFWNVIPRPVRAAIPTFALWVLLFLVIPLTVILPTVARNTKILPTMTQGALTVSSLVSIGICCAVIFLLISRFSQEVALWSSRISIQKPYRDNIALIGLQAGAWTPFMPLPGLIWGLILYIGWDSKSAANLGSYTLACMILGFSWAFATIFSLGSSVYFDFLRPMDGIFQISPFLGVCGGIAEGVFALVTFDAWAHRGMDVSADDFWSLRWVEFSITISAATAVVLWFMMQHFQLAFSFKRRFGYHPSLMEKYDPLLTEKIAIYHATRVYRGVDPEPSAETNVDLQEDEYFAVPSDEDESDDESVVDIAKVAKFLKTQNHFFSVFTSTEIQKMVQTMKRLIITEGTHIVKQGTRGDDFYFIVAGECEVYVTKTDEEHMLTEPMQKLRAEGVELVSAKTVLRHLGPGECFGEVTLLSNTERTASVLAISPVEVLVLTRSDFFDIIGDDGTDRIYFHMEAVDILRRMQRERQAAKDAKAASSSSSDSD